MTQRGVASRLSWWMALGCVGLGCDSLLERKGEEPAEVAVKAEGKGEAADEGASKTTGAEVAPADAKAVEPVKGVPATPAVAITPAEPTTPAVAITPAEPATPAVPTTPAEPAMSVVPPPATLPVLPSAPPSDTAFTEKMQRRLRSTLREQHDARTQLAASLALPHADGSVTVLALYEYSEYEACVGKSDGSPEARKACANPTDDNERVLAALRKCTGRGLVRARFGPPPKSQPAYGGELAVESTRPLAGGCTITKVRGFSFDDVDGDGQPELAVDVVTKTPQTTFRTMTPYDAFVRTVGWYRADLTPQYESALCEWSTESIEDEGGESTARRIRLEDHDGDGRADLVIESVEYMNDDCDLDEGGWLKTAGTGGTSYDDACAGKIETTTWRYDSGKDQWIDPAPPSR